MDESKDKWNEKYQTPSIDREHICPSKLSKRELEDLYFALLAKNLELKKTISRQQDKIKTLSTKLMSMTAAQKTYTTRDKGSAKGRRTSSGIKPAWNSRPITSAEILSGTRSTIKSINDDNTTPGTPFSVKPNSGSIDSNKSSPGTDLFKSIPDTTDRKPSTPPSTVKDPTHRSFGTTKSSSVKPISNTKIPAKSLAIKHSTVGVHLPKLGNTPTSVAATVQPIVNTNINPIVTPSIVDKAMGSNFPGPIVIAGNPKVSAKESPRNAAFSGNITHRNLNTDGTYNTKSDDSKHIIGNLIAITPPEKRIKRNFVTSLSAISTPGSQLIVNTQQSPRSLKTEGIVNKDKKMPMKIDFKPLDNISEISIDEPLVVDTTFPVNQLCSRSITTETRHPVGTKNIPGTISNSFEMQTKAFKNPKITDEDVEMVDLRKTNEYLAEKIKELKLKIETAPQEWSPYAPRPVWSPHTVKCSAAQAVKKIALNGIEGSASKENILKQPVSCQCNNVDEQNPTRSVGTEPCPGDLKRDNRDKYDDSKTQTLMEELKQKVAELQAQLSTSQDSYSKRISRLEEEMKGQHNENLRIRSELLTSEECLRQRETQSQGLVEKLREVEAQCGDLKMKLLIEQGKVAELQTQIKTSEVSEKLAKTIEDRLQKETKQSSTQSQVVEECLKESKADGRRENMSIPVLRMNDEGYPKFMNELTPSNKDMPTTPLNSTDADLFNNFKDSDDSGYTDPNRSQGSNTSELSKINELLMKKISELEKRLEDLKAQAKNKVDADNYGLKPKISQGTPAAFESNSLKTDEADEPNNQNKRLLSSHDGVQEGRESKSSKAPNSHEAMTINKHKYKYISDSTVYGEIPTEINKAEHIHAKKTSSELPYSNVRDKQKSAVDDFESDALENKPKNLNEANKRRLGYDFENMDKRAEDENHVTKIHSETASRNTDYQRDFIDFNEEEEDSPRNNYDYGKFQIPGPIPVSDRRRSRPSNILKSKKKSRRLSQDSKKSNKTEDDEQSFINKETLQFVCANNKPKPISLNKNIDTDQSKIAKKEVIQNVDHKDSEKQKDDLKIFKYEVEANEPERNLHRASLMDTNTGEARNQIGTSTNTPPNIAENKDQSPNADYSTPSSPPPATSSPLDTKVRTKGNGSRLAREMINGEQLNSQPKSRRNSATYNQPGTYTIQGSADVIRLRSQATSPENTDHEISSLSDLPLEKDDQGAKDGCKRPLSPGERRADTTTTTDTSTMPTECSTLSEGELPWYSRERRVSSPGERHYKDSTEEAKFVELQVPTSQKMETALQAVSDELARCRQLLLQNQRTRQVKPPGKDASATAYSFTSTIELRKSEAKAQIGDASTPWCLFTLHIGTLVLSDEAVINLQDMGLLLVWQFYDQNVVMTRMRCGRVVHFDFSTEYHVKLTKEFLEYLKYGEIAITLCDQNILEESFASCTLPLRVALLRANQRTDMSLALVAGPLMKRVRQRVLNASDELGVLDLWYTLHVEPTILSIFTRSI